MNIKPIRFYVPILLLDDAQMYGADPPLTLYCME